MKLFTQGRYATVASTAALVVALGGTSYAAGLVTGQQIKDGTVTSADIKDHTLQTKDLSHSAQNALTAHVHSTFNDNTTAMTGTTKTVLTLPVPAGSYLAYSKTWAVRSGVHGTNAWARCHLNGPGATDGVAADLPDDGDSESLANQIVFTTTHVANVTLTCEGTTNAQVMWKKVTAVKLASVVNNPGANVARTVR
jgi:hypothetical protein